MRLTKKAKPTPPIGKYDEEGFYIGPVSGHPSDYVRTEHYECIACSTVGDKDREPALEQDDIVISHQYDDATVFHLECLKNALHRHDPTISDAEFLEYRTAVARSLGVNDG